MWVKVLASYVCRPESNSSESMEEPDTLHKHLQSQLSHKEIESREGRIPRSLWTSWPMCVASRQQRDPASNKVEGKD